MSESYYHHTWKPIGRDGHLDSTFPRRCQISGAARDFPPCQGKGAIRSR